MVYRIFVEKKKELANEAKALASDIFSFLGITSLSKVRVFNRYDVENIEKGLFDYCVSTVFSEPQLDNTYSDIEDESIGAHCFAVEYLPGQTRLHSVFSLSLRVSVPQCVQQRCICFTEALPKKR